MINIDKYAYASKLSKTNPMEKMALALLTLCVCLWANSILLSVTVLLIMSWLTVKKGGIPLPFFLKLMLIPMSFLILGVLMIAFQIVNDPHQFILAFPVFGFYLGFSKPGMETAIQLFFKALGAVSCLYYLSLNTPMVDLLSALRKLKCPQLMLEMMSLIYRFIFVLMETAETMYTAQNSRLGYSSLKAGYRSLGMLASTLFIRAYKRSDDMYTAMEARGYDGKIAVLEEIAPFSWRRFLATIIMNVGLITAVLLARQYWGGLL
ncbi:cobalt ECF transporter T component CbiQ [Dehalobacter sp. DCM]|uniref:cobalt ECF transporter T component CbiQ n=1 Tax=Dehalobacter sp. DCM TaxID=2907827 RepID=UPI003081AFD3|nr:cobalt ECF transporter T component CbiQ [Dehalobacter sp. DCM]